MSEKGKMLEDLQNCLSFGDFHGARDVVSRAYEAGVIEHHQMMGVINIICNAEDRFGKAGDDEVSDEGK